MRSDLGKSQFCTSCDVIVYSLLDINPSPLSAIKSQGLEMKWAFKHEDLQMFGL